MTDEQTPSLLDLELPEDHKAGFVAIVGAPNAGKSTLINRLLQQKIAIVSPRPQTTRMRQLGIITQTDHQIIFVDTPGLIKKALHRLDEAMIATVVETVEGADVILWLVDGTQPPTESDVALAELLRPLARRIPVLLAVNKIDAMSAGQVATFPAAYRELLPDAPWIVFSAATGAGVDELYQMIVAALPTGPRFYPADTVTDTYVRVIAGEMVREQLLLQLRDEVPHALAVVVDEFKERDNGVVYIHATIFVERDSQKAIVIGRSGEMLRQIGRDARKEIEKLVESPVYLELRVKVAPKWRRDPRQIEGFGYNQSG